MREPDLSVADLGPRNAVDQVLHQLVRAGMIRRITRGLYDKPNLNALTGKSTHPCPRTVIDALARRDSVRMIVDGITAAYDIGLSDAVPAHIIVHTDARLKSLALGNLTTNFKKTAPRKLFWSGRPAMRVLQALHWLRDLIADRTNAPDRQTDTDSKMPGSKLLSARR
jgi:hypothetical protein